MALAKNFRDLEVWQLGKDIALSAYKLTRQFPKEEIYGLASQIRRAAVSVPSNVAEGFNRFHNKEYRQFLFVALGSCAELETQIDLAVELGYCDQAASASLFEKLDHEARMIRNLIKRL